MFLNWTAIRSVFSECLILQLTAILNNIKMSKIVPAIAVTFILPKHMETIGLNYRHEAIQTV